MENDYSKLHVIHGVSEIAGQNSYSVMGLREIGVDAISAVAQENPFGYVNDICLHIDRQKKIMYPLYALKIALFTFKSILRYNVFHFHFGRSFCLNYELFIYDLLNKKFFYEFHGADLRDMEIFCKRRKIEMIPEWIMTKKQKKRNVSICRKATGIILHDDEMIPYLPEKYKRLFIVPLRVDLSKFVPCYPEINKKKVRIVHAPSKRKGKGSEYVIAVMNELKSLYNNVEFIMVEGKKQSEAFEIYKTADIIVDQLIIGTYGVFSIEAMAMGKPVVTYISDEMINNFPEELPIINASEADIKEKLIYLINNPVERYEVGVNSRKYVEDYHDFRKIAVVLANIYSGYEKELRGRDAFNRVKEIIV